MPFDGKGSPLAFDLLAVRGLLERSEWLPNCGVNDLQGPHCILTANYVTFAGQPNEESRRMATIKALAAAAGLDDGTGSLLAGSLLAQWNDSQKSKKAVLALFDRAISLSV